MRRYNSRLLLQRLEARRTPTAVSWDGGAGTSNWSDALNWSIDALPGASDDVTISIVGDATVQFAGPATTVHSIDTAESFAITGSLSASDGLSVATGKTLRVVGGSFSAPGATAINSTNLIAEAGGSITLNGLTSYSAGPGVNRFRATGAGSSISLPVLGSFASSVSDFTYLEALAGGSISAPSLSAFSGANPVLSASGAGSKLSLPGVATLGANNGGTLTASSGGTADVPALTKLNRFTVSVDAASALQTSQITDLTNGGFTAAGKARDLSGLVNLSGSSFMASAGAKLTLPGTSYNGGTGQPILQADGAGSELTLPSITSLTGASFFNLFLKATNGGILHAPLVTSLDTGHFFLSASGSGSVLDLPALTGIRNAATNSFLDALLGGTVQAPLLTELVNTHITVDATSVLPQDQFAKFPGGRFTSHGGTRSLTALTAANAAAFLVDQGGTLTLPALAAYDGGSGMPRFEAKNAGSKLLLSALTGLTGASFFNTTLEAKLGGVVSMPLLTTIASGSPELNAIGGTIDLPALTTLSSGASKFALLTVTNGGALNSAATLAADRSTIRIDPTSQFTLTALNLGAGSVLYGDGTLTATVTNGGEIRPGATTGTLTIAGNYTQTAAGRLTFDVGIQSDHFSVSGSADLAGTLQAVLASGYIPALGSKHDVLSSGSRNGQFAAYQGLDVGSNVELTPIYSGANLTLQGNLSTGTTVIGISPTGPVVGPIQIVDVTFSEAISAGSVSLADIAIVGPSGPVTPSVFFAISPTVARAVFPSQTATGNYSVSVGPDIADAAGNLMNQDGDGTNGEPIDDRFNGGFSLPDTTPPTAAFVVNDGAVQRSRVYEVKFVFSELVTLPTNPGDAFQLERLGPGGSSTVVTLPAPDFSLSTSTNTIVRFIGPSAKEAIIINGDYKIVLGSTKIADAAGNALGGTTLVNFHALFGDGDGDRDVDIGDFTVFRSIMGSNSSQPSYRSEFDADSDSDIDVADFIAFRQAFGTMP